MLPSASRSESILRPYGAALLGALLLGTVTPPAWGEDSDRTASTGGIHSEYDERTGLLRLVVDDEPLGRVLRMIGESPGIEFVLYDNYEDSISVDFQSVPIEDAIKKLLTYHSYVIQQDPSPDVALKVWVMTPGDHASAPPVQVAHGAQGQDDGDASSGDIRRRLQNGAVSQEDIERILQTLSEGGDAELLDLLSDAQTLPPEQ